MLNQGVIKIGITGHLSLQNPKLVGLSIFQVLTNIVEKHPNRQLYFYSPLSPGADLLSAEIALKLTLPLVVILPFNQEDYLQTFSFVNRKLFHQLLNQAKSTIVLSEEKRDDGYQVLGNYLIKNMDFLIAIWNGQEARGPGGTGEVVQGFRQSHKPLAWIWADNLTSDQPENLEDSLPLGTIQYENW